MAQTPNDAEAFNRIAFYAAGTALQLIVEERARQEKHYTPEHDDGRSREELAAAAAYFLLPSWLNPDVCTAEADGLTLQALWDLVGDAAWGDIGRDFDDPTVWLDLRIDHVVRGVTLGLAELERLIRIRDGAALKEGA